MAFLRTHYDKKKRTVYIYDEFYKVKASLRELAEWLFKKKYNRDLIIADSSEPRSIAELKSMGIKIKGAVKGAGSIEHGEKWLDDLEAIIIDPVRCPNTAREFESIDYKVDKDGETRAELEDKDNHSIDGLRYGYNDDMRKAKRSL